jgi:uncharacterized protein YodC (DUF2158 family)
MRYVWRGGRFVDKSTGEAMQVRDENAICMPMIVSDIQAYKSPLGNHWVDGRSAQREELKRNDMVINEKRKPFDKEEYAERKAKQAKILEARKSA